MKKDYAILVMALLLIGGCSGGKQSGNKDNTSIIVNVEKDYPEKELKVLFVNRVPLCRYLRLMYDWAYT